MIKKSINYILILITIQLCCTEISSQTWKAVPIVSQKILDNGHTGGEGCQQIEALEIDHTDGNFLLMGTDVGGIYRSINGGKNWEPCNIGYHARGNAGFAIDPNNNQVALAVGGNSGKNPQHGMYLTTNQGASWEHVLKIGDYSGYRDYKDKVAFLKSSYNETLGYSAIAYWSCPSGGLYKSTNGAKNWTKINNNYGFCLLQVHPEDGYIYVANENGVFKSTDGGVTFQKKFTGNVTDMDVVYATPDNVYITTPDKLYKSVDKGETFSQIQTSGYKSNVVMLDVSEADTNFIAMCYMEAQYKKHIYYSHDGGATWKLTQRDNTNSIMPYNNRHQKFAWHPTDKNKVWTLGGGWISSSKDGCKNVEWDNNGFNGILVGGKINFNVFNPDLLYVGSQDFNGAFTKNDGKTWKYCNASGLGWGGFTYGAYAANEKVLVTMVAPEWHKPGPLTISKDGGNSFTKTNLVCSGLETACGDSKDTAVIYFREYYSKDLGESWQKMNGCKGVFIANLSGEREVYGADGNKVVRSYNKGDVWEVVVTLPTSVLDLSYDPIKQRIYIVTDGNRIFRFKNDELVELTSKIPEDQFDNRAVKSIAVDINNPEIIFCAGPKNTYKTDASVKRSLDGGDTWEIITPNDRTNSGIETGDGANEVIGVRVNPSTRELWCTGGCYGIWKAISDNKMTINISGIKFDTVYKSPHNFEMSAVVKQNSSSISKIEFFNRTEKIGELLSPPYEFSWDNVEFGNYRIYAIVTDTDGNTAYSNVLATKVQASEIPKISITSPANNSVFDYNSNIEIVAAASDLDGTVTKVEFFNNSEKLGEDTDSVYVFLWDKVKDGTYQIFAKVTDNTNQTVTSNPITITVRGEGGNLKYLEDFNDGLAQDWTPISGTWAVTDSQYYHSSTDGVDICIYNGSTFADFTYSAKIKPEWKNNFGLIFNYQNENNYYLIELDTEPYTATLKKNVNGTVKSIKQTTYNGSGPYNFYLIEVINDGTKTIIKVDGETIMENIPTTEFIYGKIGLYASWNKIWCEDISVNATSDIPVEEYAVTCSNETYLGYSESGKYLRMGENEYGVETLIITNLTVFPTFETSEDVEICQGESYLNWDESGTYQREFTNSNGCDSIIITHLTVNQIPQKPQIETIADTLTCSVNGSYFWYRNDSLLENKNTKSIVIEKSGNYKVMISYENGCNSDFSDAVFVVKTSARSNYIGNRFNIYPNPVNETNFHIESNVQGFRSGIISIYTVEGKCIHIEKVFQKNASIKTTKIKGRGTYFVKFDTDNFSQTKKIILN